MKYFTQKWCWDDLSDDQIKEASQSYDRYINSVYMQLPISLRLLAKSIPLHDGIVRKIVLSASHRDLTISGIFGDLEIGYFYLKIRYQGIRNMNLRDVFDFFDNSKLEIIRDEIEVSENKLDAGFVHRFIFSDRREFKVEFCDCSIDIKSATPKDYKKKRCSLVGFPSVK